MKYSALLKLSVAMCVGIPTIAFAQVAEPGGEREPENGEILVTARKQAESLSDVPLAITAFDSDRIENEGIQDLNDVARLTPGLGFTSVIGEFLPTPIIRGVAQTDLFGSDPNVAIFIDGVYTGAREALNFAQADIERIEVVKGPQSALYGRNAFAGAINIISKRPSAGFSGRGEFTYGTGGRMAMLASLSVPIVRDVLALKVTGSHSEYKGSHKNLAGGADLGGYNYDTIQATMRFTPTPGFEMVSGLYYSRDEISPPAVSALTPNCQMAGGVNQTWCGVVPSLPRAELSSHPAAFGQTRDTFRAFIDAKVDIGDWQLGSLTGYNKVGLTAVTDASRGIPSTFRYRTRLGAISTFNTTLLRDEGEPEFSEFSQEIRLSSPQAASVRGSVGAYYFWGTQTRPNFDGISTTQLPADFATTFPVPGPWASFFDGRIFDKTVTRKVENIAAFGHLEGDLTDKLTIRAELRYNRENQRTSRPASSIGTPVPALDKKLSFATWTPRIGIQYKANSDLLLYASAARGAKSGGFDLNAPTEQYDSEFNWTYEIGAKGSWLDGAITADVNAFFIDWSKIQIPVLDQTQTPPVAITRNLGDAHSKGFEAQFYVRPVRPLTAGFGLSYTDAEYTRAVNAGFRNFPAFAPNGDVTGNSLQASSKWQLTGSLDYREKVFDDFTGFLRGDVSYRTKQFVDSTNLTVIPARAVVNMRTGIDNDTFRLEFFVDNLFDDNRPTFAFRDVFLSNFVNGAGVVYPPRITVSHPRGREMGVRTSMRF